MKIFFVILLSFCSASSFAAGLPKAGDEITLESPDLEGYVLHHDRGFALFVSLADTKPQDAIFKMVPGLAANGSFSFQSVNEPHRYLHVRKSVVMLDASNGSATFKGDASFMIHPGFSSADGVTLESVSEPGFFLKRNGVELELRPEEQTPEFAREATFLIAPPEKTHEMAKRLTARGAAIYHKIHLSVKGGGYLGTEIGSCGPDRTEDFDSIDGRELEFIATPQGGKIFKSLGGNCSGSSSRCRLKIDRDVTVIAEFGPPPSTNRLIVSPKPTNGMVGGGGSQAVSCGILGDYPRNECTITEMPGVSLGLIASGNTTRDHFKKWTGACAQTTSSICVLTLASGDNTVGAIFTSESGAAHKLTLDVEPGGHVYNHSGVNCAQAGCTYQITEGERVELNVYVLDALKTFAGWGGDCAGQGKVCTLTMDKDRSVKAFFPKGNLGKVAIQPAPDYGMVSAPGIDCGVGGDFRRSKCVGEAQVGSDFALYASPNNDHYVFQGWSGACSGSNRTCLLKVTEGVMNVQAGFVER